jgi:4-diphosphocytidyl-2C-methyl-D-erythritol kinase
LTIAEPARAKLNLDLAVLGRRDDGFHDVRTTLQAIDLHDLITLTRASTTTLTTSGLAVGNAQNNSVLKALAALETATRQQLPTLIHLYKRIPPGAGMGGASSDAAAALRGLAALHHVTADLPAIARQLGSDVPFFLTGGTAIAEQRGDHLTPIRTKPAWFALAWPGIELLTKDVYLAWDEMSGSRGTTPPPSGGGLGPGSSPPPSGGGLGSQGSSPPPSRGGLGSSPPPSGGGLGWGSGPARNHLTKAAMHVEPRLQGFATSLGRDWQMTGSGSAFFRRCTDEREATECTAALRSLQCWTAVAQAVGAWT